MSNALPCLQPAAAGKVVGICLVRHPGKRVGASVCATCPENPSAITHEQFSQLVISAKPAIPVRATPLLEETLQLDAMVHELQDDPTLLGNRIEAWAKVVKADVAAKAFEEWTGIPCGCAHRRKWANQIHTWLRSWRTPTSSAGQE